MKSNPVKNIVLSALFMGLGLTLPFLTGQIQSIGNMLLPMHLPVFLCSLICGWQYGVAVGFVLPILRSLLFTMPIMYPAAIAMAFELSTYGFVAGFVYSLSRWKCIKSLYRALFIAMVAGRAVWGAAQALLLGFGGKAFTLTAFVSGALLNAIPGIILQLVLIPVIMVALNRAKLIPLFKRRENSDGVTK